MKKKILLLIFGLSIQISLAQNIYPETGNVGIGISSPATKLHINNGNNSYGAILANSDEFPFSLYTKTLSTQPVMVESFRLGMKYYDNEDNGFISFYRGLGGTGGYLGFSTYGIERIRISNDGNVGISTANPTQKLEVNGNGLFQGAIISSVSDDGGGRIQLQNPSKIANGIASTWILYNMTGVYGNSLQFWAYDNLGCGTGLCNSRFTIMDSGNVGIGITNPTNKLDVNGTIHSKEVKVDMTGWSDFVFKKEYNLPSLKEVEKHINEKGHLENIPSEEEVVKNGISLGEMNAKLLQKIEELTLYVIEQQKDNSLQSVEIESLKKENQNFKVIFERLTKIESQIK